MRCSRWDILTLELPQPADEELQLNAYHSAGFYKQKIYIKHQWDGLPNKAENYLPSKQSPTNLRKRSPSQKVGGQNRCDAALIFSSVKAFIADQYALRLLIKVLV